MATSDFLKALASTEEIELTVAGRKSGRSSSRPVWFVHEPGRLYLLPVSGSDTSWYRNTLANPIVQITAQGKSFTAKSTPITEQGKVDEVVKKFRDKHSPREIKRYYTKLDVAVEVSI